MIFKKLYESSTRNLFKESFSEDEFEKLFGFSSITETEALKRLIRPYIQALFSAFVNLTDESKGDMTRTHLKMLRAQVRRGKNVRKSRVYTQ